MVWEGAAAHSDRPQTSQVNRPSRASSSASSSADPPIWSSSRAHSLWVRVRMASITPFLSALTHPRLPPTSLLQAICRSR